MTIIDDILALEGKQGELLKNKGRYVQALPTPAEIPLKDSVVSVVKLEKPSDETEEINFSPTAKDYQFRINVWENPESKGYSIIAKRDLGDGIIETVSKSVGEEIVTKSGQKEIE